MMPVVTVETSANTHNSNPYGATNFMAELAIKILNSDSSTISRLIFKRLSLDEGRTDFSKNLRASLLNDDISIETAFSQIHLAGQYL